MPTFAPPKVRTSRPTESAVQSCLLGTDRAPAASLLGMSIINGSMKVGGMLGKAILLVVALVALAACGSPSASTGSTTPTSSAATSPAASTSSTSAAGSASASPSGSTGSSASATPSGSAASSASDNSLIAQAPIVLETITQLATQTGVQASNLQLQSAEATEWSDGSLGCPDPATSYIQVITPGYKMVFTDGTRTYDVHASQNGRAVWCNNGTPTSLTGN